MTKEFDELMEKRKQEKRDECNKNPNCSGTSSRVITREVSGKLYNVKMYRCGTAECVASGANIPYEGNEKYFNALNNKAVDDGKVALTAISITTGIGGLYLTSARLHALAFGSASLNASITPNQDNFASMVLTGANPFLAKIHPTIAVGVSSYQVLIEAGVVIDDR
ncbi:hypothetical protein [Shewanella piezotolerans]|nr:hypothetical protein [Shewanella piezotolerans]